MESPEVSHGIELSPRNVTGVMKLLHEKKADLAVIPYSVSPLRMKYMDLTTPLCYTTYTTLSGSPRGVVRYMDGLFDVFHYKVWICLVVIMLLLCGIFRILSQYDKHKRDNWTLYLLALFGTLTRQEFPLRLYVGNKERTLIFLFWLFGSFCLSSAFMAVFLSFVTISEKPVRIDSVEDIVKYPNVKPLMLRDSIDTLSIKNSRKPTLLQLWRQIERHKSEVIFKDIFKRDNVEKTRRGLMVMLNEISLLRIIICLNCVPGAQYYIGQNTYFEAALAYGMRKGFPYAFKQSLTKVYFGCCLKKV